MSEYVRQKVAEVVCSSPWLDVAWEACCKSPAAARKPALFLEKRGIYPPGGPSPHGMQRCRTCGRWYPPQYVSQDIGICLDCQEACGLILTDERTHVSTTSSPTAVALEKLERMRGRLIEARLPAEDEASLRREIDSARTKACSFFAHDCHK